MTSLPRSLENIYLIGESDVQICGNKLPSQLQVLKVLFYNLRIVKLPLRESAKLVHREVEIFWDKARLPVQKECRCIDKIENLYDKWRELQKHRNREGNREKEQAFQLQLNTLFDIAHGDILEIIDGEQRIFLENQRMDGRIGYINDIESLFDKFEQEELRKQRMMANRLEKAEREKSRLDEVVELASTDESPPQSLSQRSLGAYSGVSFEFSDGDESISPVPKKSRGRVNIFTPKVVAALDACRVSDRKAVHLIGSISEALGIDIETLILNRSSIRIQRQQIREAKALHLKKVFKNLELNALILHWDGKMLLDLEEHRFVDRLPVVVSNGDVEKLLGVPKLEDGKGLTQANAIYDVLDDWNLHQSVKALCCDTTASNLGHKKGAAVALESILDYNILFLPCRHHIFELILRCVFECKLPATTGPNVPMFEKFKNNWDKFDPLLFQSGIEDERVMNIVTPDHIERVELFVNEKLKTSQPRDDYKELLDLTLIFLGRQPSEGVKFRYPGAVSHARWMSKAIYSLKIFLFRDQFSMSAQQYVAVRETCIFIVMVYIEAWFTSSTAIVAPNHDLQFLKKLHNYRTIDEKISDVTVEKMSRHLWYLSPENVALSLFDDEVSLDVKRKMVEATYLYEDDDEICPKRFQLNPKHINTYCDIEIDHFVTPQTRNFLTRFAISEDFLKLDPCLWSGDENYRNGLNIVKKMLVVNDIAERGVHLFTQYNNGLTRNEDQKQFVLQVVSAYQEQFPNANKETIMKDFE